MREHPRNISSRVCVIVVDDCVRVTLANESDELSKTAIMDLDLESGSAENCRFFTILLLHEVIDPSRSSSPAVALHLPLSEKSSVYFMRNSDSTVFGRGVW